MSHTPSADPSAEFTTGKVSSVVIKNALPAMIAMTGSLIGNLLNVILDPIFILGFKWGIAGAGVQPVIGYCYAAKNRERTNQFIRFSIIFAPVVCLAVSVLCFVFARPVVGVFLTDATAMESSISFTRIMLLTAWLIGAFVVSQNALQAMGAATSALLASILRQAVLFIPIVFILHSFMGMDGIIWAQPAADVISLVIIIIMLLKKLRER